MARRAPILTPDRGLALVLAAGWAACLALDWPGWFSPDSVWQLLQGRTGVYDSWHPPVMAWMLGAFDRISPGAPGFFVFDAALGYGGLWAFGALGRPVRPWAALVAAGLCASPLMLIYQGDVWKDVLFADAGLAGFAALAWAGRLWDRRGLRWALLGLAALAFALATLARQNGAIVAVGGCVTAGWIGRRAPLPPAGRGQGVGVSTPSRLASRPGAEPPDDTRKRGADTPAPTPPRKGEGLGMAWALGMLAAVAVVAGAGQAALAAHTEDEAGAAGELEWLQVWDLAGAVHADPHLALSGLRPDTTAFLRAAAPAWSPQRMDGLVGLPGADEALDDAGPAVARVWSSLVLRRPDLYVRIRLADFVQVLATPRLPACRPLFLGLDGPPAMLQALKPAPPDPLRLKFGRAYGLAFVGTPVLSHLAYLALATGLFALALRGRTAEDRAVAAMLACAGAFAASFAVGGVACDYRYLYPLDLFAMAALLHRCAAGWPARRPVFQLSRETAAKTR